MDAVCNHITTAMRQRTSMQGRATPMEPGTPATCTARVVPTPTVALYGLTEVPVARRLGVTRPARSRPLMVGGDPWVIDLARAFRTAGLEVLMWAPSHGQRTHITLWDARSLRTL
jgi:hypothetical protein